MKPSELNRRDFSKLTVAALGGMLAGSAIGCGGGDEAGGDGAEAGKPAETQGGTETVTAAEKHLCRGLNACKGQGKGGDNACAGQGMCATYEAHVCGGQNACKGQGGCGEHPGQNECKGQGHCAVPLMDSAWDKLRADFENSRKEKGLPVGEAPAAAG